MKRDSLILKAAKDDSVDTMGFESNDHILAFSQGAKWAIEYCDQVIRRVLEHYEDSGTIYCIMADYYEIITTDT